MSDLVKLRKYVATIEETFHDGGPQARSPGDQGGRGRA